VTKHLLLIGFSCTGKTGLGRSVFGDERIIDSDDSILAWIGRAKGTKVDHIYELYMSAGREQATHWIEEAEEALIDTWAADSQKKIISLGPGFPLRVNWSRLRAAGEVVLFRLDPDAIYDRLTARRDAIFAECPEAAKHDTWDVGVMVDENRNKYSRADAVANITRLLTEREGYYKNADHEMSTENKIEAERKLRDIGKATGFLGAR